jgi:hypothetical protein
MAACNYKLIDSGKSGASPAGPVGLPGSITQWAVSTTWAAGAIVQNGAFLFKTTAGGAGAASGNGPSPQYLVDSSCTWILIGGCTNITASESTPSVEPGLILSGLDPNCGIGEFIYTKLTGATAMKAGDFVCINFGAMTAVLAASGAIATGRGMLGIVMGNHALNVTTPLYGWVMLRGTHTHANVTTGVSTNVFLFLTATAGRCAITTVATYSADGVIGRVADAANNVGQVDVLWPSCTGKG